MRALVRGNLPTLLAGHLGALGRAGLDLAPGHGDVEAPLAGDRVTGGEGDQEAGVSLDIPTDLGRYLSGDRHTLLTGNVQTDLGLDRSTVLTGDGTAHFPGGAGALLSGH